jgi:hypothetical protein
MSETKETVQLFQPFFDFLNKCAGGEVAAGPNVPVTNGICPELKPFMYAVNADAVGHQKALLRGGGCKSKIYFCPYCCATSDSCYVPNNETCSKWCEELYSDEEAAHAITMTFQTASMLRMLQLHLS